MTNDKVFTPEEYQRLVLVAIGKTGATKEQIAMFIGRCAEMRTGASLLNMLLDGRLEVTGYSENDFHVGIASGEERAA